jgi:hypothetical protein
VRFERLFDLAENKSSTVADIFSLRSVWFKVNGGNVRGEEGSKIPHKLTFCFPPNWRDSEGRRGEE